MSTSPSLPILTVDGPVATLTLNRPAHRNRLEDDDLRELLQHFDRINQDTRIRVAVLRANTQGQNRPVFSAGYHVGGFEGDTHDPAFFQKIPDALARLRPITVCALNGSVYGGATDLLLACDLRIGLQGCELRMPAVALGLHYYPSGLQRYVALLGLALTQRAFLTGRPLRLETLAEQALFESLCSADTFEATLQTLVDELCQLAPLAAETTKASLWEFAQGPWLGGWDTLPEDKNGSLRQVRERENLTSQSVDFAEGRQAFLDRRKPAFQRR
jgi:enoyl-CoA hydratase/carnithine racemase